MGRQWDATRSLPEAVSTSRVRMPGGIVPGAHRQRFADAFISRAAERHAGNLDFSLVEYVNTNTHVKVRCILHGVTFSMTPNCLIMGGTKCGQCKKAGKGSRRKWIKTVDHLVEEARRIHGERYSYAEVCMWSNMNKDRITIICPIHGPFLQRVVQHLNGRGCKHCTLSAGTMRYTTETWVVAATAVHGDRFDYSKVQYVGGHSPVTITCLKHGVEFQQEAAGHLSGAVGCQSCATLSLSSTTAVFVQRATEKHEGKYTYEKVVYVRCTSPVLITCPRHGDFWQAPANHLAGSGCPNCFKRISQKSLLWLAFMSVAFDSPIRHGDNEGEFVFPEKMRWKCDGYIEATRTVFEFHGSYWHGDPSMYPQDQVHPQGKNGRTYGDFFQATKAREAQIRAWGYTLLTVWESDWDRAVRAVVAVQKTWRARQQSAREVSYRLSDVWARV